MSTWSNEEMQAALAELARRAAVDPEFRSLAIQDGAAALAQINPKPLPADIAFRFVENSGQLKTVPLPDLVEGIAEELSDLELEQVAGGAAGTSVGVTAGWSKAAAN